ncbi:MAG TPA: hypothetical protein DCE44_16945, partial [Verrucomicrobiales bacterium]|nr:hypothetical protein [Verrucomicrobiales bacterium]
MKLYFLKPIMTTATVNTAPRADKPVAPPRQPLPTPVLHPDRPTLKLGLDVHLEFIMAVVQRDHASAQAPRKFTADQLVAQINKWTTDGLVVYSVQESCGFGFVLPRRLVEA